MFKIGEFSKLTQVSIRMLRYYDETGLLKPCMIDPWTNYRMYSVEQIPTLNKIIYLRDSGFQVSEIADILHTDTDCYLIEQLENKCVEIEKNIEKEKEKLKKLEIIKSDLFHNESAIQYHISIKSIPAYHVLSIRRVVPTYYHEGALWKELSDFARETHADITDETFSIYHDAEYKEEWVDIELCAEVKKAGENKGDFQYRTVNAVPIMASTMVYGAFSNIAGVYLSFANWLQENSQYRMGGQTRQIVHRGAWNEEDPKKYLTEIQIPLEKI